MCDVRCAMSAVGVSAGELFVDFNFIKCTFFGCDVM